eukprot:6213151-Pleurochrysis_carterae.AAC.1
MGSETTPNWVVKRKNRTSVSSPSTRIIKSSAVVLKEPPEPAPALDKLDNRLNFVVPSHPELKPHNGGAVTLTSSVIGGHSSNVSTSSSEQFVAQTTCPSLAVAACAVLERSIRARANTWTLVAAARILDETCSFCTRLVDLAAACADRNDCGAGHCGGRRGKGREGAGGGNGTRCSRVA